MAFENAGTAADYWDDRAHQCRKWLADMKKAGERVDIEYIVGGLRELEGTTL